MNVLNRPMFRQAGGPAEPMPQDMGPEAAMLQEAEAGAMSRGQEVGAEYAQNMMQGIDQAQSTEDLINALRGNDKSLEARRSELAGFVGQDDANQTPESVLAMVQPVVMMTEEGMMDSGIGALVQGLVGDVEMTTASGAPTDMGMGVGSLMAAGAQEAPAPQNFRQGGEVAHLQKGSNMTATAPALSFNPLDFASESVMSFGDTVKGRYEDLLPLYQEILGADQESKDATKAQMLFDVAQGGLQLAAGVPGAGSSLVSQLAGAAAPVAGSIQERGAALEKERRGIKQGALGTAMQQALSDEDYRRKLNLTVLDASLKGTTSVDDVIVNMPDGTTTVFDLKRELPAFRQAIQSGGFVTEGKEESPYGSSLRGQALERLSSPEGVQNAILGLLGERSQEALLGMSDLAEIQEFSEQTGQATAVVPTHLQPFVRLINDPDALREFQRQNRETKETLMVDVENMATEIANGIKDPSELYDYMDNRITTAANIDMESGTGLPSAVWATLEYSAQQFSDIFNFNIGDGISDSDQARRLLDSVMQSVDRYVAGAPDESRLLQQQYERLVEQLPKPSMFETDAAAREGLRNYRDLIRTDNSTLQTVIKDAQLYSPRTLNKFRIRLMNGYNLEKLLNALYENYDKGPSAEDIPTDIGTDVDTFLSETPALKPILDMRKYYTGG